MRIKSGLFPRAIHLVLLSSFSLLNSQLSIRASAAPITPDKSQAILLHAIVEAPVDDVWSIVSTEKGLLGWLVTRCEKWECKPGADYAAGLPGGPDISGKVFAVEPKSKIALTWEKPATTLTISITELDKKLTMITLEHAGWPSQVPEAIKDMHVMQERWITAMIRLHRCFPPPVVDLRMHRPKEGGLFVDRSLIINGDFEHIALGKYPGIAYGWEPNFGRALAGVQVVKATAGRKDSRAQMIANPQDWNNLAVQQFTSQFYPMIEEGKRYRLSAWVKAEGIENPNGWYKLGLWATDMGGKPIGESIKNEKLLDDNGEPKNNHDWYHFTIEATAPPGAARAVVILSGHWDRTGEVIYDDVQLWEIEKVTTSRSSEKP